MTRRLNPASLLPEPQMFRWQGEARLSFPTFGGILHVEETDEGIDAAWLGAQELTLSLRRGGERLKSAWNRPTRNLKAHYQYNNVPAWERSRLPLVFSGQQLLYAAGIGMDCRALAPGEGRRLRFLWEFETTTAVFSQ